MKNKIKNIFIDGPILPSKIAESIQKHQSKKNIGGHNIFLGQVRADVINGQKVSAIDYSAQTKIANQMKSNMTLDEMTEQCIKFLIRQGFKVEKI